MLTGTQEGAQRNIFTTEQICQVKDDVLFNTTTNCRCLECRWLGACMGSGGRKRATTILVCTGSDCSFYPATMPKLPDGFTPAPILSSQNIRNNNVINEVGSKFLGYINRAYWATWLNLQALVIALLFWPCIHLCHTEL